MFRRHAAHQWLWPGFALLALGGCAPPDLPPPNPMLVGQGLAGDVPHLMPITDILAQAGSEGEAAQGDAADSALAARASALRTRAARLRDLEVGAQ